MSIDIHALAGRPVIVGGGIAGLMTALQLAPEPVVLVSKAPFGSGASTVLAQGGLAACLGGDDHVGLHLADTLAAGDGLCDADNAARIVQAMPTAIETLIRLGVPFDRDPGGALQLGLEAAHCRRRIIHAGGDSTGRELMKALLGAVRSTPSIMLIEGFEARRILRDDIGVTGVLLCSPSESAVLATNRVVLATGGIGGLFLETTNPTGSFGQGLALAANAGAEFADLEFVQFHPTAFDGPARPMNLVSEAVRGEGAVLIDEHGNRFLADLAGAELAPRDRVSRAVAAHLSKGHRVFLDVRQHPGAAFPSRFPAIHGLCVQSGLDPLRQPIPVRPAVHYHMGGVAVDASGRSSVEGLWACGEVACTGLHGANRLASNSLSEAAVMALWVAESVAGSPTRACHPAFSIKAPPPADPGQVKPIMSRALGITRDGETMQEAAGELRHLALNGGSASDPAAVGLMITIAALQCEESRGAHFRADFSQRDAVARRSRLRLEQALDAAREFADEPMLYRSA